MQLASNSAIFPSINYNTPPVPPHPHLPTSLPTFPIPLHPLPPSPPPHSTPCRPLSPPLPLRPQNCLNGKIIVYFYKHIKPSSMRGPSLFSVVVVGLLVVGSYQFLNPNCMLFNSAGDCLKCKDFNYLAGGVICFPVSPLCVTYSNITGHCLSCVANYMLATPTNGTCFPSPADCATIDLNATCTSCLTGYTFSAGLCTPTPIPNCLTQTVITCSACKDRYYLANNTCPAVSPLCLTYNATDGACLSCNLGYSLTSPTCSPTPISNCLTQVTTVCNTCKDRYYLSSNACLGVSPLCLTYSPTNGSCLSCIPLYTLQASSCSPTPIPNCLTQTDTTCAACEDRYYLSVNSCLGVSVLCETYSPTNGSCLTCFSGYTLSSGSCSPTPIANCLTQAVTTCQNCKDRFYLSSNACLPVSSLCATYESTNGNCLSCIPLYTLQAGACSPTPIPNCLTQTATACSACKDRYYLSQNSCLQVSSLCETYDSSNGNCLTCIPAYTLQTGSCSPTPIPNCLTQTATSCSVCVTGYYLFQNGCHTADSHCTSYSSSTGDCLACISGYFPRGNVCFVTIAHCLTYAPDNGCSLCNDGFLSLPADKIASPTAMDQCLAVCPFNSSLHTFADYTLKQCVLSCSGANYGDFTTEGHPICTADCVVSSYFRDSSSKLCVASCPSQDIPLKRPNSYGDPTTKTCVSTCPANTFIDLQLNRTCVSKCGPAKWGDSITQQCTSKCSRDSNTGKQYYGENTTQLCTASCPLPTIPDKTLLVCVPTPQSVFQGRWEASGNMQDYIKDVHDVIDASLVNVANFVFPPSKLARSISDALNGKWSTAWNVIVVKTDSLEHSNSIVYGYAFENHWMWVNGYGQFDHSFIIWKDYNCQTWVDLTTPDPASTLPQSDATLVNTFVDTQIDDNPVEFFDPWVMAYDTANYLNQNDASRSYTTVVSQGHLTFYNARFCGFGGQYQCGVKTKDGFWLTYLLIRTR